MKLILSFKFLALIVTLPAIFGLLHQGYFPSHDVIHVVRIFAMFNSLHDGQFPVRWVENLRYGEPLFNFYAPLPYYFAALWHYLGFDFFTVSKITFIAGVLLSSLTMFALGKELFGKFGGLISAVIYTFAPYRAVDIYVRGALSESWSFIFFPLIFLFSLKVQKSPGLRNFGFLVLSLGGLFYTHNVTTIMFFLLFLAWLFFLGFWLPNKFGSILNSFSIMAGLLLSASFLLPAFFERQFIQSAYFTLGYFDFHAHFVAFRQWFQPSWGYGPSVWGPNDGLSFQVGIIQWVLVGIAIVVMFNKIDYKIRLLGLFLIVCFLGSLFMQHNRSTFIWEMVPVFNYIQFPWRFLALTIFLASLLSGMSGYFFKKKLLLCTVIILFSVVLNFTYFQPKDDSLGNNDTAFINEYITNPEDKLPKDYLPMGVKDFDRGLSLHKPRLLVGSGQVEDFRKNSFQASFKAHIVQPSLLEIPTTFFPGWKIYANSMAQEIDTSSKFGLIGLKLNPGDYFVRLIFEDTAVRKIANLVSLVAFVAVLAVTFNIWDRFKRFI